MRVRVPLPAPLRRGEEPVSNHQRFWTARKSDKALLEAVNAVASIRPGQATVEAVGVVQSVGVPRSGPSEPWDALFLEDCYTIQRMVFGLPGCSLEYFRGGRASYQDVNSASNPHFDEVYLSNTGDAPSDEVRIAALTAISQAFPSVQFDPTQPDPVSQIGALQQSRLDQLEHLNRKLVDQGLDYRRKVDEEVDAKCSKLEQDFQRRVSELESDHEQRDRALALRERELESERKRIDDSDNTTARRQIRERMLEDVKLRTERFGVSEATVDKRRPVRFAMQTGIATLMFLTLFAALEVTQNDSAITSMSASSIVASAGQVATTAEPPSAPSSSLSSSPSVAKSPALRKAATASESVESLINHRWVLWFRLTLASLATLGMLLYYIRWENSWAQRHADAEFNLQQFHVDVNRANWIIESCLEWKKSTASDIPPDLLASLSRGLFSYQDRESTQVLHPADELASALFGAASKVRLKSGDSEVELDAKKVPKDVKV